MSPLLAALKAKLHMRSFQLMHRKRQGPKMLDAASWNRVR